MLSRRVRRLAVVCVLGLLGAVIAASVITALAELKGGDRTGHGSVADPAALAPTMRQTDSAQDVGLSPETMALLNSTMAGSFLDARVRAEVDVRIEPVLEYFRSLHISRAIELGRPFKRHTEVRRAVARARRATTLDEAGRAELAVVRAIRKVEAQKAAVAAHSKSFRDGTMLLVGALTIVGFGAPAAAVSSLAGPALNVAEHAATIMVLGSSGQTPVQQLLALAGQFGALLSVAVSVVSLLSLGGTAPLPHPRGPTATTVGSALSRPLPDPEWSVTVRHVPQLETVRNSYMEFLATTYFPPMTRCDAASLLVPRTLPAWRVLQLPLDTVWRWVQSCSPPAARPRAPPRLSTHRQNEMLPPTNNNNSRGGHRSI